MASTSFIRGLCFAFAALLGSPAQSAVPALISANAIAATEDVKRAESLEKCVRSKDTAAVKRAYVAASDAGSGAASRRVAGVGILYSAAPRRAAKTMLRYCFYR